MSKPALDDEGVGGWGAAWIDCPICSHREIGVIPFRLDGEPQPRRVECSGCGYMVDIEDVEWIASKGQEEIG